MEPPDRCDHKEPALTIKRNATSPQGGLTSTLKWEGQTLVISSTVETPSGSAVIAGLPSLSPESKVLTQKRLIRIQGQEISRNIMLIKQ